MDMSKNPPIWLHRSLLALAVLPIVLAIVRAIHNDWFPIGDDALLYLRAGDVLTRHHPLLGSWTSASLSVGENMNNPGPIYQDLITPFAKMFSPGPGAAIGVGAINIATVLGISTASKRVGGWALQRWMLLAAVGLSWSMGSELLIDIWQAHAMMLPFLLVLILLMAVASGRSNCLPWAIGMVSLLVQTHISHAYILAILCPVTAFGYAMERRARPHRPWRDAVASRPALWSCLVGAVLWSQPLYEQFFGPGKGNLSRLLNNAGGGSLQVGPRAAMGIVANLFTLPTWWSRYGFNSAAPISPLTGTRDKPYVHIGGQPNLAVAALSVAALLVLFGALYSYNRRRQRRVQASAILIALTAVIGACLAVSELTVGTVGFSSHHVRFLWPTAVFVHVVLAWTTVEWLGDRWQTTTRVVPWAVAVATAIFAVAATPYYAQPAGPVGFYYAMPTLRRVFPELEQLRQVQPVLFDVSNARIFEPYSAAVMMQLRELGIEFRVDGDAMVRQLGESRRADGSEHARIFQLQGSEAALYSSSACLVVIASDLSAADERRARQIADRLAADVADGNIAIDPAAPNVDGIDTAPVLAGAIAGDVSAARFVVYEGYLYRWFINGNVTADRDLTVDLDLINRYIGSVYALYSEQSPPCI